MKSRTILLAATALVAGAGCISVKTESEIKPIHITMDVNLKVDKELDKAFKDENMSRPSGAFKEVKSLLDRKAAGINNKSLLEPREGATDDDKILIAESNARRMKRFEEVSKSSGVAIESVQKRSLKKCDEQLPAGSGIWIQDADGAWRQK